MEPAPHVSVMPTEVMEHLNVKRDAWYVDCTFGAGGHSRTLLELGAKVLAIDQDPLAATYLDKDEFWERATTRGALRFAAGNFRDLERLAFAQGVTEVAGVLLDLGVSSMQLDEGDRGFAFRHQGPLDMRMAAEGESAADVVNEYSLEDLAAIIFRYGEERHSRRVARRIVQERDQAPIDTTQRLADVVASAYPPGPRREHPARRTFQALRIHVNDELGALQEGLEAASRLLVIEGRLAVLSYHSLEDRIVKRFLLDSPRMEPLTKRPLGAADAELADNPRSRSAKLRAGVKVAA
ncbi:MAG TPA: 16S rRNA (cytosine(1402)-N(4))-methyltransferase RsmH [Trueperaceae bacterium]|nr:16S rRNA (cytosine(1402)-N(4))-methyltransferase RsmH [Trueperaceae bacterium]